MRAWMLLLSGVPDITISRKHYFLEPLRTAVGVWGLRMLILLVVVTLIILYLRMRKKKGDGEEE